LNGRGGKYGQKTISVILAIYQGRDFRLSDDMIQSLSVKVGDFLANGVCPATKEELVKEFWGVATPEEREA